MARISDDSWAQYSWFDNTVKGDDLQSESYKSKDLPLHWKLDTNTN